MRDGIEFIESLLDPHTWKRVGMVIFGALLIIFSLSRFALSANAAAFGRAVGKV